MSIDAAQPLRVFASLCVLCAKPRRNGAKRFALAINAKGCIGSIEPNKGDRRVLIKWDTTAEDGNGAGTAILELGPNNIRCLITDKNMTNNTCQCSNQPPT